MLRIFQSIFLISFKYLLNRVICFIYIIFKAFIEYNQVFIYNFRIVF